MKIYTNENNTSTLKLLIAANLAGKKVEVKTATFAGPRSLPLLEVDEELTFFSSNAAVQYLLPVVDLSVNGQCQQMQEWEATRLQPSIQCVLTSKTVASDLKQLLMSLIGDIDALLAKRKFILGDKLSAADISVWSTLYPLYYNNELKSQYFGESKNVGRWFEELAAAKAVQEAVKTWGGSVDGPFGSSSALGSPQVPSLQSPGSPEEPTRPGPSPDEIAAAKESWARGHEALPKRIRPEKVILPVKGRKNILITSALPYVNNVPHLGNIIGCVLSADMFARYCRLCNYNTLYVSGTDEYGTATETKALEEGLTPRQICDKYYAIHNDVYRWFDIGFDYFGRTSTPEQTKITQEMFLQLRENGFISPQSVDQLHCTKCNRFLADRFVEGTCHHPGCLYDSARGDQCDKCGRLVNAVELVQPRCKVCGESPVIKASEQLFLELGQLEPSLRCWVSSREAGWSAPARAPARAWLREGLRARAITRDLAWGVPVPHPGYANKVFYVWFDAPMGYLSITECATKQYEKWWKPDKGHDVTLYQFMAKDNVPFHAIMFPATLLGVNQGHTLVSRIFATEYLNYEEGKFSKSRGVGVFGTDAQDTGIPADVWRFYLASIRPETSDSSFSWTELATRNNSELLNNVGNFCHRSLSFCAASFNNQVPPAHPTEEDFVLMANVNREIAAYVGNMERGRLREALRNVLAVSRLGNQHMQARQPWLLLKGSDEDRERGATAVSLCCQLVALLCSLLAPYMPAAARRLSDQLRLPYEELWLDPENPALTRRLAAGHALGAPAPLFSKIEAGAARALRGRYAGPQAARQNGDLKGAAEIEAAIAKQGEVVRKLKASTKDKSVWQPEVEKLLQLKKQLTEAQATKAPPTTGNRVESLEKAVSEQGEVVRKLKASTKDKSVWQPEVEKLLQLKKQLTEAQATKAPPTSGDSVESLEKAVSEQGEVVRKLKASTKDKSVWQPEVEKLLQLKKQLTETQATKAPPTSGDSVESLEKAVSEQGEKVRKLKASTKDKSVWQPEVNVLLALKKQLAALQINK